MAEEAGMPFDCICISKVTKFKANNNCLSPLLEIFGTVFA